MKYYIKGEKTKEVEKSSFYLIMQNTPNNTRTLIEFKDKKILEFYNKKNAEQ